MINEQLTKSVHEILSQKNTIPAEEMSLSKEKMKIDDSGLIFEQNNSKTNLENVKKNENISTVDDFLTNKQIIKSKIQNKNAYGLNNINPKVKTDIQGESNLLVNKDKNIENKIQPSFKTTESINSSIISFPVLGDNLMNSKSDQAIDNSQKIIQFSDLKSSNPNQIIDQISDYILQVKASKEESVHLKINHEELGLIDITVKKLPGQEMDNLSLAIGTQKIDGKIFFDLHSRDLMNHLSQAGVNVVDLKIEQASIQTSASGKNDFDMNDKNSSQNSFGDKNYQSEQNQRRNEQNRRQELWNILREKEVA